MVALGGLGEIGMNCLALVQQTTAGDVDAVMLVDCGTNFPQGDYGIDVIHPDFSWLEKHREALVGVFLTHGHEDHIGALPYLLQRFRVPVWGPAHALHLAKRRLLEHELPLNELSLREVRVRSRVAVGPFVVEPIRVSHSIVEATALAIETVAGTVVHTGDFKFDPAPSDGQPTDEARLAEIGANGVALLLSDSTNVDREQHSGSEADVEEALDQLISKASARVFVALFASNVQRLISLGKIAERRGRRICLMGRSLNLHVEVARELGHLKWKPDLLLPVERARSFPKDELLVLAGGTQGEPGSAMYRISQADNRYIDVEAGDEVIFSSRVIPGNERRVVNMMGDLLRLGANVRSRFSDGVHTSGHASRPEQAKMIRLLAPRCFVPLHGTRHHLVRHAELARELGVPQVDVIENGQSVVLHNGCLMRGEAASSGYVHIEWGGTQIGPEAIRERQELGRCGLLSIGLACDRQWELTSFPSLDTLGLPELEPGTEALRMFGDELREHWRGLLGSELETTIDNIRRFARSWTDTNYGLKPMVSVHVSRNKEKRK